MSKIPKIEKFKGDNSIDFKLWITQFEVHLKALVIEDEKRLDILFCCIEGTAFSYLCNLRAANENITYQQTKVEFERRFCGEEYKRNLQIKLQNLKFVKGTPINSFATELRNTIRALYNIQDTTIINDISMNHLLNNLDESLRQEAKIFQLTGNKTLENLLEFVNTKWDLYLLVRDLKMLRLHLILLRTV